MVTRNEGNIRRNKDFKIQNILVLVRLVLILPCMKCLCGGVGVWGCGGGGVKNNNLVMNSHSSFSSVL